MNSLLVIFFFSYFIYALSENRTFLFIYFVLLVTYIYFTQFKLFNNAYNSVRTKTTIGTWGPQTDPSTYIKVKLDFTKTEKYLHESSSNNGEKYTITTFVIKLLSIALKKFPEINGYIKFGKYNEKDSVDVTCLVKVGDGQDLVNGTLRNVDNMDLSDVHNHINGLASKIKSKKNEDHNRKMNIVRYIPTFIIGPLMQTLSYLSSIGVSLPFFGVNSFEFGGCVITSVGSLGITNAFPPIPRIIFIKKAISFSPMLVTICKKKEGFRYNKDHKIESYSKLPLNFTFDMRFISTETCKGFNAEIKKLGEDPEYFEAEMKKYLIKTKTVYTKKNE